MFKDQLKNIIQIKLFLNYNLEYHPKDIFFLLQAYTSVHACFIKHGLRKMQNQIFNIFFGIPTVFL